MDTEVRDADVRVDAPQSRSVAGAQLALCERLLISALVIGVSLWIRVGEVISDRRRR
ncbi:MAG: hypothetical protein QOH28_2732 [Actinomycetota bacterium]|jgi:hypothetical protein|nr:hypothetical protein [Actinomycetota bacterium]